MPQLRLADGDRALGAPHVPHHQAEEHGQTGNREGNEGKHVSRDLAAGPHRLPRKAGNRLTFGVGNCSGLLVEGRRSIANGM